MVKVVDGSEDERWKYIALGVGGFLAFSLLPIWRSGSIRGQSLLEFLGHHSVFSESEAMWIREDDLEAIRNEARV